MPIYCLFIILWDTFMQTKKVILLSFCLALASLTIPAFAAELNSGNIASYGCAKNVTTCDINNKTITSIAPGTFSGYSNLQSLDLQNNQLTSL